MKTPSDNIEGFAQVSCEEVYPHENLTLEVSREVYADENPRLECPENYYEDAHLESAYEERTELSEQD